MAVQQRRVSKTRKRKRRTHYKLRKPTLVKCNHCGAYKRPHHVCPTCGYYKDTQYVEVEPEA